MKFLLKRRLPKEEKQQQTVIDTSSPPSVEHVAPSSPPSAASPHRSRSPCNQVSLPVSSSTGSNPLRRRPVPLLGDSAKPPTSASMAFSTVSPGTGTMTRTQAPSSSSSGRAVSPSPRSSPLVPTGAGGGGTFGSSEPMYKDSDTDEDDPFADIPSFKDAGANDCQELFRRKLQACCIVYDFNRNTHQRAKESKRQTLLEMVEFVNNTRNCFTDTIMQSIVQMVAANIFRALAPPVAHPASLNASFDPEEEEPALESAWPHLQIVYEFFLRFIVSNEVDPKVVKRYIDQQFVLKLLDLFASEDPRERDYLKTILHRIYGKIMALRSFIRRAIQHTFYGFVYEHECHKGVSELLEILGSIINGFALPLKEEHKIFLEKSLIPLHKARSFSAFNQQLTYCMTQYVEKDNRLAEVIIMGLLRYWPVTNTNKEAVFLNELEEILDLTQPAEFQKVMIPLFRQLALCIQSPHFQVAERVLFFWNNEYIVNLFNSNKEQLFPIIISALYKNSKDHWNSTVHGLTYNVSKLLAEVDPDLFDECSDKNLAQEEGRMQEEESKESKWKMLESNFEKARLKTSS